MIASPIFLPILLTTCTLYIQGKKSSEGTRIAYFPVNLMLKETYGMDRQTGIGIKDKYLMLFFKIVLLERHLTQTTDFVCPSALADERTNKKYKIQVSDIIPMQQKKRILKIGQLELILEGGGCEQTDGRAERRTDGQTVRRTSRRCQNLLSTF